MASPLLATMLVVEVARPKALRSADTLVAGLLSSSIGFAVYFPIAGSSFVGIYTLSSYKYEDWQLLAAVPPGPVAAPLADRRPAARPSSTEGAAAPALPRQASIGSVWVQTSRSTALARPGVTCRFREQEPQRQI